jgi:lactoylglutathione lyase
MVHVRDLERSIAFYSQVLGCSVAARHDYEGAKLAYLRFQKSPFELELIAPDRWCFGEEAGRPRTHLALAVTDLEAEHRRISQLGVRVELLTEYHANGHRQTRYFYITDLDGNQIELLEATGRYADAKFKGDE